MQSHTTQGAKQPLQEKFKALSTVPSLMCGCTFVILSGRVIPQSEMATEQSMNPEEFGNKRNTDFSWELVYQEKPSHKHISSPGRTLNLCNLPFTQRLILCPAKHLHTMKHCLSDLTSEGPSETSLLDSPSMLNQLICSPVAQSGQGQFLLQSKQRSPSMQQCSSPHGSYLLCSCSGSSYWFTNQLLPVRSSSNFIAQIPHVTICLLFSIFMQGIWNWKLQESICTYLCDNHFWLYHGITDVPQPCRCTNKVVLCLSSRARDANNLKPQMHTIHKHPVGSTKAIKSTPSK